LYGVALGALIIILIILILNSNDNSLFLFGQNKQQHNEQGEEEDDDYYLRGAVNSTSGEGKQVLDKYENISVAAPLLKKIQNSFKNTLYR